MKCIIYFPLHTLRAGISYVKHVSRLVVPRLAHEIYTSSGEKLFRKTKVQSFHSFKPVVRWSYKSLVNNSFGAKINAEYIDGTDTMLSHLNICVSI